MTVMIEVVVLQWLIEARIRQKSHRYRATYRHVRCLLLVIPLSCLHPEYFS